MGDELPDLVREPKSGKVLKQVALVLLFERHVETKIKVWYIGPDLPVWFDGTTEKQHRPMALACHELLTSQYDRPILDELGSRAVVPFVAFRLLLEAQPNGEEGALATDGTPNVLFVKDKHGVVRAMRANWFDVHGWSLGAVSVEYPDSWCDGTRIFSLP